MAALSRRACGLVLALAACSLLQPAGARSFASPSMGKDVKMNRIGKYESGVVDDGSMEIVAYDAETKTVAVVDASDEAPGITLLDVEDPTNPKMKSSISYKGGAAGQGVGNPNSVVFHKSMLIVGAAATTLTDNGFVTFFKLDGTKLGQVEACPLPDNVVVNDDGSKVYVACEGEPSDGDKGPLDNTNPNPAGAIGVVDVTYSSDGQFQKAELTKTISLQKYIDGLSDEAFNTLKDKGFMLDGRVPKDQAAVDMEPEYIALGGGRAYVSLQENNAIAVVDLETEEVTDIWPMGIKDWSGMMIDISGEDADGNDAINRQKWPYLWGLYQPDTIVYHTINGKGYLFTANEGDAKDNYEMEVSDLADDQFDLEHFSDPTNTKKDHQMGKLKINPFCGLKNGYDTSKGVKEQGPYSYLCSYGGRSFSIIDTETGKMVADSGDDLEDQVYKEAMMLKDEGAPFCFNCDNSENNPGRSDNKGCEPEAIEVFTENGRTFAIVGLERQSSIVVYEVTEPSTPVFVQYFNNRNYDPALGKVTPANAPQMGMLGPEMLKYVPASSSPNGIPMLISSGEVSGTLSVFEMDTSETDVYGRNSFASPSMGQDVVMKRIGRYQSGVVDDGSMEIVAYDAETNTIAVVDASDDAPGITLLDVEDPTNPKMKSSIPYKGGAAGQGVGNPNSVVFHKSMLIVGAAATTLTDNGFVTFFKLDGTKLGQVEACPLPDNVVVNDDGSKVYVACEGEPSDGDKGPLDNTNPNPAGAIGVVDVTYSSDGQFQKAELTKTISLQKYIDGLSDEAFNTLKDKGFMLDGRVPKDQAAVDMEPEYIALGGGRAYVSLQENNAIAVVDLETEEVTDIWPMGIKDWSGMMIDISGEDADGNDAINRQKWPYLWGLYQPDTIVYHTINGKGYLFTANEGDAKDNYEMEVSDLADDQFDLEHFSDPTNTKKDHQMGKLKINPFCGLKNGYDTSKGVKEQGPYSYLCSYGGRSFSIIDTETGKMVADSGDDLEDQVYKEAMMLKAKGAPFCFNCDNNENDPGRSDNKGCEPEAIEVFTENGRTFAIVGLERQSSIVVYEVTEPTTPVFVRYFNNRNYDSDLGKVTAAKAPHMGMLGPEMLKYVPASSSPNSKPMLISSGEVSGTLSVFEMEMSDTSLYGRNSFGSSELGQDVVMKRIGRYQSGVVDDGSMEIVAFDADTNTVAVVDASDAAPGITLLDVKDPTNPKKTRSISYKGGAAGQGVGNPNSVVFHKSMLIVGAAATDVTENGYVTFWNLDGDKLGQVEACPLPDNVVVNNDGSKVYVACEGEPSDDEESPLDDTITNPAGAIGVVDVTYSSDGQFQKAELTKTISLQKYIDGLSDEAFNTLKDKGFMLDGRVPKDQAAVDMEPEYIALGGGRAYVSLQENNAIAVVDLETEEVTDIWPMGIKDWSNMEIDISGKDADGNDAINRQKWTYLRSLYQPDTIVYHTINGKGYLFTANEGDAKDTYEMEISELADSQFDLDHFPDPDKTRAEHQMGKLAVHAFCGLKNGYDASKGVKEQGPYSYFCAYGGRSFSIIDTETGKMVADSGDDLEDRVYQEAMMLKDAGAPFCFNCDNNENDPNRSDNKGCEPEAIEVFTEEDRTFALVGLERQSSIVVYEVTDPESPVFVRYFNNRNYDPDLKLTAAEAPQMGMLGPEMLKYVPASSSPNGKPMLISSGEISGTLSVFQMELSQMNLPDGGPSPDEVPTSSNATIETTVTVDAELSEVNAQEFAEEMRSTYERNLKKLDSGIMETATVTAGTPKEGSIILPLTVTLDSQTSSADLQAFAEKINDAGTDTLFDGTNYKVTSLTFDNLDVDNAASSCVMNFVLAAVMLGFALLM